MSDLKEFNVIVDIGYQAEFRVQASSKDEAVAVADEEMYFPDVCIGMGDAEMVEATTRVTEVEDDE